MAHESARETLRRMKRNPAMRGEALPSERTIQDIAREFVDPDPDDPWAITDAEAAEAALVLPVLAQRFLEYGDRTISRGDAKWAAIIRRALPGLELAAASMWARVFHVTERHGDAYDAVPGGQRSILDRQLDLAVAAAALAEGLDERPEWTLLMQADWWAAQRKDGAK
jgi:hypothetical protein